MLNEQGAAHRHFLGLASGSSKAPFQYPARQFTDVQRCSGLFRAAQIRIMESSNFGEIVRYMWRTYATPLLPPVARPFAGLLEALIVAGIEAAYQLALKRR